MCSASLRDLPTIDNPKGELQELLQAATNEAPQYKLESTTGPDHDRVFECTVHHRGDRSSAAGVAKTRKKPKVRPRWSP